MLLYTVLLIPALLTCVLSIRLVHKDLVGTEGTNITLPDRLMGCDGMLTIGGTTPLMVSNKMVQYKSDDRLSWNSSTGQIAVTNLQKQDAGNLILNVKNHTGGPSVCFMPSTVVYKLTVYAPVAGPTVETVSDTSESCLLLCSVDKAAEVTLWWSRDEEMLNQTSSADSLLLMVTQQNLSSSYRCEAGNPAENRTLPVPVQTLCSGLNHTGDGGELIWCVLLLVPLTAGLGYCLFRRRASIRQGLRIGCTVCCDDEEEAAEVSSQAVNGNMENHPMMPPDDDAAKTPA